MDCSRKSKDKTSNFNKISIVSTKIGLKTGDITLNSCEYMGIPKDTNKYRQPSLTINPTTMQQKIFILVEFFLQSHSTFTLRQDLQLLNSTLVKI